MSDQEPSASAAPFIDGARLINLPPAPGAGLLTLNGDPTPAQIIVGGSGILVNDVGASHAIFVNLLPIGGLGFDTPTNSIYIKADAPLAFDGVTGDLLMDVFAGTGHPGYVPDPGAAPAADYLGADGVFHAVPSGTGNITEINGDATPAQIIAVTGPATIDDSVPGTHTLILNAFAGNTHPGYVPNPGAAPATDYLGADAAWHAAPILSIAGDATPAQLLTIVGPGAWSIPVAGTHRLTLTAFGGNGAPGYVPDPATIAPDLYLSPNNGWQPHAFGTVSQVAPVNIPDNTFTVVLSYTVAAGHGGLYMVTGGVAFSVGGAGSQGKRAALLHKGSADYAKQSQMVLALDTANNGVTALIACAPGDVIQLVAYTASQNPQAIPTIAGSGNTWLSAVRLHS